MGDAFVGEIRIFPASYLPEGWLPCDGRVLRASEQPMLFSIISNTYGGDGRETFAIPDLTGRAPLHQGGTYRLATGGGADTAVLTPAQMPPHHHLALCTDAAASNGSPEAAVWARQSKVSLYNQDPSPTMILMAPTVLAPSGGGAAHENRQPFLAMCFAIATDGEYPPRPS